jgi:hypothetical protein
MPSKSTELSTINRHYSQYKYNARRKNFPFELGREDFLDLVKGNCFYCGTPPKVTRYGNLSANKTAYLNGIDRYDNTKGYTLDNVKSCCSTCNFLKGTLHGDAFLEKVKSISEVISKKDLMKQE